MKTHTKNATPDLESLAEDARALLAATADVAEEKVVEARERLATALNSGKEFYDRVRDRAVEGAKAADHVVREHPYQAVGIAFGVGALVAFLLTRRN
jgi:ElaB/YqjD/DUF883 family membrane-anchored ribosome-binding protein